MKKTKIKTNVKAWLLALLVVLLFVVDGFFRLPIAYAEETKYSDVLDDLRTDTAFNAAEYDNILLHSKTELIQIAESSDRKLFIYLHIVGDKMPFEKIVFNTATVFAEYDFRSYNLELVGLSGGFCKYLVNDYTTSQDSYHTYSITRLEYPVDRVVSDDQKVTYEYYPIEQIWTVRTSNGKTEYSYEYVQTVEILDKYVGEHHTGVTNALGQYSSWTETFYIAFSTDWVMDDLIEVQIEYTVNVANLWGDTIREGDKNKPINIVINSDQTSSYEGDTYTEWWFISWKSGEESRTFKSICKPDEFKSASGITVPKRENGSAFDWVVTFYNNTDTFGGTGTKINAYTYPADTTILRLKFETDGVCYNLGVLDNRTSYIPPKIVWSGDLPWWVYLAIAIAVIILLVVLVLFISPVLSLLSFVGHVFVVLLKALWWLVSAPVRLIKVVINRSDKT